MAFGLNRVELIGRIAADAEVVTLSNGTRIAKLRVATDESYVSKQTNQRVNNTEWHQVVTFQPGVVTMFEKHARKGRLVFIQGKLQTRRYRKEGEETDRFATEIMVIPGSQVSFLDKSGATTAAPAEPAPPPSDDLPTLDESYPMAA